MITDPRKTMNIAQTLTASWNCKNFLTLSKTLLPYLRATTIEVKLSSKRTISAAALATSVPVIPIANPTLEALRAGASLDPSPVIATTASHYCNPVDNKSLSVGEHLAITLKCSFTSLNLLRFPTESTILIFPSLSFLPSGSGIFLSSPTWFLKFSPVIAANYGEAAICLSSMILAFLEIAIAVSMLSPVAIIT